MIHHIFYMFMINTYKTFYTLLKRSAIQNKIYEPQFIQKISAYWKILLIEMYCTT